MMDHRIKAEEDIPFMIYPQPKVVQILSDAVWVVPDANRITVVCALSDQWQPHLPMLDETDRRFLNELTSPQGYLLRTLPQTQSALILAKGEAGLLYAREVLRQLIAAGPGMTTCPHVRIHDWPDFEYRGASRWLLCGEATRWSYDWGEGRERLLERFKSKIDRCFQNRSNVVFFHGIKLDLEPSQYHDDMRMLSHYARRRNVKLVFACYGIGIGGCGPDAMLAEAHSAVRGAGGDYNRATYPDGEPYPCCGNNPKVPATRKNGTCRSNEALNRMKMRDMREYVRLIQPSAMYIHHEDISNYREARDVFWAGRCPQCRERWPNDTFEKIDGGAGGVAHGYDQLCEGVFSVKDEATGYDAVRDCTVFLASPGYGELGDSDEEWAKISEYWVNVSRAMRHVENVVFVLREQVRDGRSNRPRVAELAERIKTQAKGHQLLIFAVGGADLYINDAPFSAAPMLNGVFRGAAGAFNFSGVVFQGLQELFNAECLWNAPSKMFQAEASSCRADDLAVYERYMLRYIPDALRQRSGPLAAMCEALYGRAAGQKMFEYCLLGDNQFPLAVLFYRYTTLKLFNFKPEVYDFDRQKADWEGILNLTLQAETLVAEALACDDFKPEQLEETRRLLLCLRVGKQFARITRDVFARRGVDEQLRKLDDFIRDNFTYNFYRPGCGDSELWSAYIMKIRTFIGEQA